MKRETVGRGGETRETTAKKRKTRTRDPKFGRWPPGLGEKEKKKKEQTKKKKKKRRISERNISKRYACPSESRSDAGQPSSIVCTSNAPPATRRSDPHPPTHPQRDNLMLTPINTEDQILSLPRVPATPTSSPRKLERPKRSANYASFLQSVGTRPPFRVDFKPFAALTSKLNTRIFPSIGRSNYFQRATVRISCALDSFEDYGGRERYFTEKSTKLGNAISFEGKKKKKRNDSLEERVQRLTSSLSNWPKLTEDRTTKRKAASIPGNLQFSRIMER